MDQLPPEASQVFARLNEIVHSGATTQDVYDAIVHATVELVDGCDRAAILLRDRERLTSVAATDPIAKGIDELEVSIGDGPCLDAILDEAVQFDPDLVDVFVSLVGGGLAERGRSAVANPSLPASDATPDATPEPDHRCVDNGWAAGSTPLAQRISCPTAAAA